MKSIIITLAFTLLCITPGFSQFKQETPQSKLENDIKNNTITLYILGGIAARVYEGDAAFREKYQVKFHDFGCLAPLDIDFYKKYNQLVFDYFNKQYGTGWQAEIRPNIVGWENWKEKTK